MQRRCPTCGRRVPTGFEAVAPPITKQRRPPIIQIGERTERAWLVPIAQSLTSGVIAGSTVAVLASFDPEMQFARIGALSGLVTTSLVWGWSVKDDARRVWYKLENTLGLDLDRDGVIGEPASLQTDEKLLPVHNAGLGREKRSLQVRLTRFVEGCELNGTSQNYWEQSRKMERPEFVHFRDALISLGWAAWRSEKTTGQGWKLLYTAKEIKAGMFRGNDPAPHPAGSRENVGA